MITDSVIDQNINISKYNPLAGSSYIKLLKELNHLRKSLINNKIIDDNKYLKWCLVKYSNPVDNHPARIRKIDKLFRDDMDFKDITFPIKVKDIHRVEKKEKNSIGIRVFTYERKDIYRLYVLRNAFKKYIYLLLVEENDKNYYVLIKDFNFLMYGHTLQGGIIFTAIVCTILAQKKGIKISYQFLL